MDTIADGTLFSGGAIPFGDAFDIAMQINTTDVTSVLLDNIDLPNLVTAGSQSTYAVQTFSPSAAGVGTADTVGANTPLTPQVELETVSFVQAPSGTATAGGLFVNVYSGGSGDTGTFLGSSTNAIDVNTAAALSVLTWDFASLTLNSADTYSLVFSTTNTPGSTAQARLSAANNGGGFVNTYSGGVADDSGNAGSPLAFDTRFAVSFSLVPTTVYVDDSWAGNSDGDVILDADLGTAGNQGAIFGIDAFGTIGDALATVSRGGTIIVNGGTYSESVTLNQSDTLKITGSAVAQNVTIDSLGTVIGTTTVIEGSSSLTIGDGTDTTLAGAIVGTGSLTKVGAGNVTLVEGGGTFNAALANTYVSTAAATTIIPGLTVADVTGVGAAIMNGASIGSNTPATAYNFTNDGTTATFDLALLRRHLHKGQQGRTHQLRGRCRREGARCEILERRCPRSRTSTTTRRPERTSTTRRATSDAGVRLRHQVARPHEQRHLQQRTRQFVRFPDSGPPPSSRAPPSPASPA